MVLLPDEFAIDIFLVRYIGTALYNYDIWALERLLAKLNRENPNFSQEYHRLALVIPIDFNWRRHMEICSGIWMVEEELSESDVLTCKLLYGGWNQAKTSNNEAAAVLFDNAIAVMGEPVLREEWKNSEDPHPFGSI